MTSMLVLKTAGIQLYIMTYPWHDELEGRHLITITMV
jgi:hypothetical protein